MSHVCFCTSRLSYDTVICLKKQALQRRRRHCNCCELRHPDCPLAQHNSIASLIEHFSQGHHSDVYGAMSIGCSAPSAGDEWVLQLLYQCRDAYVARLEELPIPVAEKDLLAWSDQAAEAAYQRFDKEKFGGGKLSRAATLRDALATTIDKEFGCRFRNTHELLCRQAELARHRVIYAAVGRSLYFKATKEA